MLALLLLTAALQQQPERAAALQRQREASAAFDSTTQQVVAVGGAIADVKSSLDLYRRAAFNGPDADVLSSGAGLGQSCRALERAARVAARKVCRRCGSPDVQRALEGYRGVMPGLTRMGARCATRITALERIREHKEAAAALRRDVRAIGNAIVEAITPYEQRLQVLRVAAGWAPSPVPPPSPGDRPGRR